MIGLITVTRGGRLAAARLAAAWPGKTRLYDGPAREVLPRAWAQCEALVCFLAVGATVRLIAPLLDSKWTDPAVVCLDESARHAVAVVGGHAAGANTLATRVAGVFGADAVITTSTDAVSLPGLDVLGWPTEGAIGTVSRALLDGERVRLESAARGRCRRCPPPWGQRASTGSSSPTRRWPETGGPRSCGRRP
jgi:cobalt-precorrin 5A hydrolase/precorrin-3B C17-methyltransferase